MNKDVSEQLQGLIRLISFFKQIRHKDTLEELAFFFANDLNKIIPYTQCIIWNNRNINFLCASGQVDICENSALSQFLKTIIKNHLSTHKIVLKKAEREDYIKDHSYAYIINLEDNDYKDLPKDDVQEYLSPHSTHILLLNRDGIIGGVWLSRDKALGEMEKAVLEDSCDALADKMFSLSKDKKLYRSKDKKRIRIKSLILIALGIFCLWPVRFSVTTYTEITAQDSFVVTVPIQGLIDAVNVKPNQSVVKDETLFSMQKIRLQNEYALSKQSLNTALAQLSKTEREVFGDPKAIPRISALREDVKLKELEVYYAKDKLALSDIKAPRAGTVLFSDKNDFLGKPAQAGDAVMTIADPKNIELLVRIPTDSMIKINKDVPIKFFLNTSPLISHEAKLFNVSYQASVDPDGLMTYKARASIKNIDKIEKVGLTGTAKIYGDRTIMIVNLLRRPLIALRNLLNI